MPDDSNLKGPRRPSCPICAKAGDDAWRPFCSRHCADIELGRWLGGGYAFPGELAVPEPDESG